jgi:hypothetical protein
MNTTLGQLHLNKTRQQEHKVFLVHSPYVFLMMERNFVSLSPFLSMKRTKTEATEETTKEKKETKGDDEGTRIIRKSTF